MNEIELSNEKDDDNEENNNNINNNINNEEFPKSSKRTNRIILTSINKNNNVDKKSCDNDKTIINNKSLKEKCFKIICILTSINLEQDLLSLYNLLIIYILSIHNFIFYNAFLFSDKAISARYYLKHKLEIKYLLTKEFDRILLVFLICKIINKIFAFLLNISNENLNLVHKIENETNNKNETKIIIVNNKENTNDNIVEIRIENSNENESEKIINSLINSHKCKIIAIQVFAILIQIFYLYFF